MRTLRRPRLALAALSAGLMLVSGGCGSNPFDFDELGRERQALAEARQQWASTGVDSYEFTVSVHCMCGPLTMRVRVVDGVVVSRVRDGQPVPTDELGYADTVEELFAYLERALDQRPAEIDVDYGARGVPTHAFIDWSKSVFDEESGFGVADFTPIAN